ncbi:MAG: hypothetical protein WBM40_03070, partial [Thiohalocapsa sp.]
IAQAAVWRGLRSTLAETTSSATDPYQPQTGRAMTEVEQIEQRVRNLSPSEFAEFRTWFREQEWEEWDRQIEEDSKSGKLKALAEKALADHAAGRTTPI